MLFFLGWLSLVPASAEEDPAFFCLWNNSGQELLALASSPAEGSWQGYLLAAGFTSAAIVALQHDLDWYQAIQAHRNDWQEKTMPVVTLGGDSFVEVAGFAALYKYGNAYDQKIAAMCLEGQINVAVLSWVLKLSGANRPEDDATQRRWFTFSFSNNSFPSGHSMSAFCTAVILGDAYHIEWLTYPLAALVAYSRVYNQNHWPSDVIAGAGLGILAGEVILAYHQKLPSLPPGVHISVLPTDEGAKVALIWQY